MHQPSEHDGGALARLMRVLPRRARNGLLGGGTVLYVVWTLFVPYSRRGEDTLFAAMAELLSSDGGFFTKLLFVIILLAASLPVLLLVEMTVVRRPFSRRMRRLLIAQGVVGLVGAILTYLWTSLTLCIFMFGGDSVSESIPLYIIPVLQVVFSVASLRAARRRSPVAASVPEAGH